MFIFHQYKKFVLGLILSLTFGNAMAVSALEITSVGVNFVDSQIIIQGVNFDNGKDLKVNLSNNIGQLEIASTDFISGVILVNFPVSGLPEGTYRLSISSGGGEVRNDELAITVGTHGATGAQGSQGDTGATGAQGPAGADGVDGVFTPQIFQARCDDDLGGNALVVEQVRYCLNHPMIDTHPTAFTADPSGEIIINEAGIYQFHPSLPIYFPYGRTSSSGIMLQVWVNNHVRSEFFMTPPVTNFSDFHVSHIFTIELDVHDEVKIIINRVGGPSIEAGLHDETRSSMTIEYKGQN